MTPLEKAARETWKLREQYMWPDRARRPVPDDIDYASGAFSKVETETRAIIRAFLEAAAEDADAVGKADNAFWHTIDRHEPPKALRGLPAKAAILALKETING